jgi:hypothetical protein
VTAGGDELADQLHGALLIVELHRHAARSWRGIRWSRMEPRVSASVILDQIRLMNELYGGDAVASAKASLPLPMREEIDGLLAGGWCTTSAARELKTAVAERVGMPLMSLQRQVVRTGIERTLNTVWRFFMRQMGDEHLMKRAPLLYSRAFDRGEMVVVSTQPGEASFEVHGWPQMPDFDLLGLAIGIETVLALGGRDDVHVTFSRKALVVHLRARWTPRE